MRKAKKVKEMGRNEDFEGVQWPLHDRKSRSLCTFKALFTARRYTPTGSYGAMKNEAYEGSIRGRGAREELKTKKPPRGGGFLRGAGPRAYLPMALRLATAASPMTALMRRTPAEELSSLMILKATSSEVF